MAVVNTKNNKNSVLRTFLCCSGLFALINVASCGVLSSPERSETPSALILKAQAAYDAGDYSSAVSLLEPLVQKDPGNVAARTRLAYSHMGTAGVSILNMIKSKIPSDSGSSTTSSDNINSLTQNSGLPAERIETLKSKSAQITTIESLREQFTEFQTFQKAFEVLCPVLPSTTLIKLNDLNSKMKEVLNISSCGSGTSDVNSDIIFATLFLTLAQVSTLQPVFLGTETDGKTFSIEAQAKQASDKITTLSSAQSNDPSTALTNLQELNRSLTTLNTVVNTLEGEVVKFSSAQITILSAVVGGSNLPDEVKTSITKLETSLNTALNAVNKYSNKSQSAASSSGTAAGDNKVKTSLTNAKSTAEKYFQTVTSEEEKLKTCKNIYCAASSSGQAEPSSFLPSGCQAQSYACSQ